MQDSCKDSSGICVQRKGSRSGDSYLSFSTGMCLCRNAEFFIYNYGFDLALGTESGLGIYATVRL